MQIQAAQLPSTISYSPLHLSFLPENRKILRRDLYDARFQVMDQQDNPEQDTNEEKAQYVDADTDLIPGTYEGGLKTWEGGVDLVQVLAEYDDGDASTGTSGRLISRIRGQRIMEVGCGTALPLVYLLQRLLEAPRPDVNDPVTTIHLQDFNLSVLHLVTLPNLILAVVPEDLYDPEAEQDLELTPEIIKAFTDRLAAHRIVLEFSYGPWQGLAQHLKSTHHSQALILTAETIYREDSVDSLIDVLKSGAQRVSVNNHKPVKDRQIGDLADLALRCEWPQDETIILVAAKVSIFFTQSGLSNQLTHTRAYDRFSTLA